MKKIITILVILSFGYSSFSQTSNDVGKISLSIVMPENSENLNSMQLSKIETKISQIVTESGLGASGVNNSFVIYPKFAIYETNVVEGGMQNITIVTADLSLNIKQVENNILFSSISKQLKGSGSTKELAITNAISKIPTKDSDYLTFIAKGKTKIIEYYSIKCEDIIRKSDGYVKMQQYEEALGLLMTVPEEATQCYTKTQEKAIEVYKIYQTQKCAILIQKAKTLLAANKYIETLEILSDLDPSASCFSEGQEIARTAEMKVDDEEKRKWDFHLKQYNDEVSLKKMRIDAIKEIAVSYYKSKPTSFNYNYIIR